MQQDQSLIISALTKLVEQGNGKACQAQAQDYIKRYGSDGQVLHLLGVAYHLQNNNQQAEKAFKQAVQLAPDYADLRANFGVVLRILGKYDESLEQWEQLRRINPDDARVSIGTSECLNGLGKTQEAAAFLQDIIKKDPTNVQSLNALGNTYWAMDMRNESAECFQQVLRIDSDNVIAHSNLALLHHDVGRMEQATYHYDIAIKLGPNAPEARNNRAIMWLELGQFEKAQQEFKAILQRWPEFVDASSNLALSYSRLGKPKIAVKMYKDIIKKFPQQHQFKSNFAKALLVTGDFIRGWAENEWRWQSRTMVIAQRPFVVAQWAGEPLEGKTLLIHAEQGYGDSLQFARYLPLIMQLPSPPKSLIFEVQEPLVPLMQYSLEQYGVEVIERIEAFPEISKDIIFDMHCPLLSLPMVFKTQLLTMPVFTAYLHARDDTINLPKILQFDTNLRVGLVWAGAARKFDPKCYLLDQRRSIELTKLYPLLELQQKYDVSFFSLQLDEPREQLGDIEDALRPVDLMDNVQDFSDTATLINGLDLVISVDTAVVHLAAGLGKPVWLLNRFDHCWRWLDHGENTIWYHNMRLYRQTQNNSWPLLIDRVASDLKQLLRQLEKIAA